LNGSDRLAAASPAASEAAAAYQPMRFRPAGAAARAGGATALVPSSAALTRSGVKGGSRSRTPVAS
jgi:hypothetical protein